MKYRKKPVVIEAEQFTTDVALDCLNHRKPGPFGISVCGKWNEAQGELYGAWAVIETPEGKMRALIGDWIIKGVKGELYPCKPDIFEATYEPAEVK